jgi:hypothetical protein
MTEILHLLQREPQSRLIDDLSPAARSSSAERGLACRPLADFPEPFFAFSPYCATKTGLAAFGLVVFLQPLNTQAVALHTSGCNDL